MPGELVIHMRLRSAIDLAHKEVGLLCVCCMAEHGRHLHTHSGVKEAGSAALTARQSTYVAAGRACPIQPRQHVGGGGRLCAYWRQAGGSASSAYGHGTLQR